MHMQPLALPRYVLGIAAVAFIAVGVSFILHLDWATSLWPERSIYSGDLTDLFVGSIFAAIGASAAYGTVFGDARSAAGGLLALVVLFGSSALVLTTHPAAPANAFGRVAVLWLFAALAAIGLPWSLRSPPVDGRAAPMAIRIVFVAFTVVLLIASALLIAAVPNVFPWPLSPLTSALYGCLFLGVSMNYAVAAWRGKMIDGKVSLFGFLIYDLILIVPFVQRFAAVPDENRPSLTLYVFVLVFSAAAAVWLFWFDRAPSRSLAR